MLDAGFLDKLKGTKMDDIYLAFMTYLDLIINTMTINYHVEKMIIFIDMNGKGIFDLPMKIISQTVIFL